MGCKVIILDPLQDVLDSLPEKNKRCLWLGKKGMVKSHKVSFINVNHVRKNGTVKSQSAGADLVKRIFMATVQSSNQCMPVIYYLCGQGS